MLLRSILSKTRKQKHFASFCSLENARSSLLKKPDEQNEKAYVISYLVNRCGLSPGMAVRASKRVQFDTPEKPNAVLEFLSKHGFTKCQISNLVSRNPSLLRSQPEKTLLPKMEYFSQEKGLSETETRMIVSRHTHLLTRSLEKALIPICNYLSDIIGPVKLRGLIKRGSWIFGRDLENDVIPNVELLKEIGVPESCVKLILRSHPDMFGLKPDKFKDIVDKVKQMGFDVSKTSFVLALCVWSMHDIVWHRGYETFSRWGWSEDDIYTAFRKHPYCMFLSEKKISSFLDFVVNELDRDCRSIAHCPWVLFYSMEKRIVPRCSVVQMLCSKGLVKKDWNLSSVLVPSENIFIDKFVKRYADRMPQLYDLYKVKGGVVEA